MLSDVRNSARAPVSAAILFLCAIVLGATLGVLAPVPAETLSQGIALTLLSMILLLFFELRPSAVLNAFGNIRFLVLAWTANFLIIPAIGFGIATLVFSGEALLFAGLMIYFLAPCTDWFLGFTRMANGDTELGAALIPVNIITQLLLFPLWLWAITVSAGLVDLAAMPALLLQWFVVPLVAAQAVRFLLGNLLPVAACDWTLSWISHVVPFVLAILIFQIFAVHIGTIAAHLNMVLLVAFAVCLFFVATLLVGEVLSRFARLTHQQRTLLAMTMAARNAPLMLALTAVAVPDQPLISAVIVAGMLVEIPLLTALKQVMLKRSRGGINAHVIRANRL